MLDMRPDSQIAQMGRALFLPAFQPARAKRSAVEFAEDVLRLDLLPVQREILEAMDQPRARVAVKAAHGVGKTKMSAVLLLYFVCELGGRVVSTAPTNRQVHDLLWNEVRQTYGAATERLGGTLLPVEDKLYFSEDKQAVGFATDRGVQMQGYHAPLLIWIIDEAPGINPEIWRAIRGSESGGDVRILQLGNPVVPSGDFFNLFNKNRQQWKTFTIDAMATPNLIGFTDEELAAMDPGDPRLDEVMVDWAPTRRWVRDLYLEGDPDYVARVRGQFPGMGENQLIAGDWCDAVKTNSIAGTPHDPWEGGIDVAGSDGGDETVLTLRHGGEILGQWTWRIADAQGPVIEKLNWATRHYGIAKRTWTIKIDSVGIGHYFVTAIKEAGYVAVGVNVATKPKNPDRFRDAKAEHYWALREVLREAEVFAAGGLSDKTIAQLTSIQFSINPKGQIVIESKDEMKKRGLDSPDRAESLMLAFARPGQLAPGRGIVSIAGASVKTKRPRG